MNMHDASKILGLTGKLTEDDIKTAYRKCCSKYHPDRDGGNTVMMQLVNAAYSALKDCDSIDVSHEQPNYGEEVNTAISAIIDLPGLFIEICGSWVWVSGETKQHKEALKAAKFKYCKKKQKWAFRPADYKSTSRGQWSMDKIRDKYGSKQAQKTESKTLSSNKRKTLAA